MANEYFEVMTSIINKKKISDDLVLQHFNGWGAMIWLSAHPKALYEANLINSARGNKYIDKLSEYKALKGIIKIPKSTFLKMDKLDKDRKIILKTIKNHFNVGNSTAEKYYNILNGRELIKIFERYSRLNENMMSAKELKNVKEIRDILNKKRKEWEKK